MSELIGTVAIIAVGLLAWWYNHRHVSLRATLDYISTTEGASDQWLILRNKFSALKVAGSLVALLGSNEAEERTEDVVALCTFLNHFELTAVGIKHKILDETLYKEWFRGAYVKTWQDTESFVVELRKRRRQAKLFLEFQELARRWAEEKA